MIKNKKIQIIFLLTFFIFTLEAQVEDNKTNSISEAFNDFRSGYVILQNNDTLFGEIDYRNDIEMSKVCHFKKEMQNEVIKYLPKEIKGYRFINSKNFISREIKESDGKKKLVFLEFLINGKLCVYYYRDINSVHYYIEKDGENLIELPYDEGIKIGEDGLHHYYKSTKHIGILNYYTNDAPQLESEILEMKEPDHKSLIKLAKDYHKAVCGDYSCIVYVKNESDIHLKVELFAGNLLVGNLLSHTIVSDSYFVSGINLKFWLPRINENIYFKTGVQFMKLKLAGYYDAYKYYGVVNQAYLKFPLQFEYLYPKGIIQPRIGYGYNFYIPYGMTQSFNVGLDIHLIKKLGLSVNAETEFLPEYFFIPQTYFGTMISGGIFYCF